MENQPQNPTPTSTSYPIPAYVLDDLCSRFIINVPEEERQESIRVFFQIELAHWFYLDFYCAEQPELRTCGIKDFSVQIFKHCPVLTGTQEEVEKKLAEWKAYKLSVPTYGAIILDPEIKFCLLVQGWWVKSSWGFPKGKVNAAEAPHDCASREVMEETGLDISKLIDKNVFLETDMNGQLNRLYIVPGVPLDTHFQPKTRKEIKSMQWFPVDALPSNKRDQTCRTQLSMNPNNFFMVIPFVKPLRKWIASNTGDAVTEGIKSKQRKNQDTAEHRQRQKRFAQQNMNELLEFLPNRKERGQEDSVLQNLFSGVPRQQPIQSPRQNRQQFQILNRDGTINGNQNTRRNLNNQFDTTNINNSSTRPNPKERHRKSHQKDKLNSESWLNFRLDADSLLACIH
ncbi:hypothetical protein SNE40_011737 [Patella caerulea]|uniref:m7GpppN-mRNA hydrolase n=1 Tax=Patella caerulea TaxID=87958 RepID=A0AAN8PM15_PATCE